MENSEEKKYLTTEELNSFLSKMKMMYRPPGGEYTQLTDYLNEVEYRLQRIEDALISDTTDS